jgi:hypothetical protein
MGKQYNRREKLKRAKRRLKRRKKALKAGAVQAGGGKRQGHV